MAQSSGILGKAIGRLARYSIQSYAGVIENAGKMKKTTFNNPESQVEKVLDSVHQYMDSALPYTNYAHPYANDANPPSVPVNRAEKIGKKGNTKSSYAESPSDTIARIRSNRNKSCILRKLNQMKKKSFYKMEQAKDQVAGITKSVFRGGSPQTAYNLERPNLWKQVKRMSEEKRAKRPSFVYRVI